MIGKRLHHRRDGRTSPAMEEGTAATIRLEVARSDPVVVFELSITKPLPQPDQVQPLIVRRQPVARRNWTVQPDGTSIGNPSGEWIGQSITRAVRCPRSLL